MRGGTRGAGLEGYDSRGGRAGRLGSARGPLPPEALEARARRHRGVDPERAQGALGR